MKAQVTINAHPHPGQAEVHRYPSRFKVLAAGRRWGKTRLGVNECLDVASNGGRAWWVSPSYKTSEVGWRPLRRIGAKIGAEIRKVDRMIILPSGGEVTVRSADNPDSLRGEGLNFCVMDECAFMSESAWTEAIRPALSDRLGSALFISTPKGHNWFWRLWMRGQDDRKEFMSWRFPTASNPYIPPSEIEAARAVLPELIYRQEYEAEFIDDAGGVFRFVMERATSQGLSKPQDEHQYIAGVDVATLADFTAVKVLDVAEQREVYCDRFNRLPFEALEDRLHAIYKAWKLTAMIIEVNGIGLEPVERLNAKGLAIIPFTTTNATKTAIIQSLASAFEHNELHILPDPTTIGELQAYEGERTAAGGWKYSAPEGLHDDTVMALALAWFGIGSRPRAMPNPFYDYEFAGTEDGDLWG